MVTVTFHSACPEPSSDPLCFCHRMIVSKRGNDPRGISDRKWWPSRDSNPYCHPFEGSDSYRLVYMAKKSLRTGEGRTRIFRPTRDSALPLSYDTRGVVAMKGFEPPRTTRSKRVASPIFAFVHTAKKLADRFGIAPNRTVLETIPTTRSSTTNIHQAVLAFNLLHHGRVIELTRCRTLNPNLLDENGGRGGSRTLKPYGVRTSSVCV